MRGTIVELKQISRGAPEQWEGRLKTGEDVFARERHGEVRIELNGVIVCEKPGESAYDALCGLFEIELKESECTST